MKAILYSDGASRGNPGLAGAGAVLLDADGRVIAELTKFLGVTTNNVAEYEGFIIGLEEAQRRGVDDLEARMDSMLVVEQMRGRWKIAVDAPAVVANRSRFRSLPSSLASTSASTVGTRMPMLRETRSASGSRSGISSVIEQGPS